MDPNQKIVTLTDIAKEAGVSVMTVSRALRDAPKVSERRKREITRIARELGYRPNPELSRLMSTMRKLRKGRQASVLAIVNTFSRVLLEQRNDHLKAYYDGVFRRAEQLGFQPELFSMGDEKLSDARLGSILYSRGIEAVVILPFPYERRSLDIDFSHFAVAAIGRSQSEQGFHRACPNQFQATRLALQKCHEMGYRRPGLVLRTALDRRSGYRYSAAYLQYFHENPEISSLPIIELETGSNAQLKTWIKEHRPDVVFGLGPRTMEQLVEIGYDVPRDLGFVNLFKIDSSPDNAGVDNQFAQVGAAAVDIVVAQMHSFEHGLSQHPKTILINGTWVDGESLRPQA